MKTFVSSLSYKSDALLLKHTYLLRLNITNFSRGLESFNAGCCGRYFFNLIDCFRTITDETEIEFAISN